MLKAVAAATAAITIAGSSVAYAQRDDRADGSRRWQPTTEDIRAFQAARLAALHAGLTLTTEQEKHWSAFEQAMRELQKLRLQRIAAVREARRDGRPPISDPSERMRQRATRLSESGAILKRLADATDPFYRSLDEAQKRRFAILTRIEGPRGWQRRGPEGGETPRGQRRSDITPTDALAADAAPMHSRTMVDGDHFAQAFVSQTGDGLMVGRVFGAKTLAGDLAIGEVALVTEKAFFGGKSLFASAAPFSGQLPDVAIAPVEFGGKLTAGGFGRKITIKERPTFGRKTVTDI